MCQLCASDTHTRWPSFMNTKSQPFARTMFPQPLRPDCHSLNVPGCKTYAVDTGSIFPLYGFPDDHQVYDFHKDRNSVLQSVWVPQCCSVCHKKVGCPQGTTGCKCTRPFILPATVKTGDMVQSLCSRMPFLSPTGRNCWPSSFFYPLRLTNKGRGITPFTLAL